MYMTKREIAMQFAEKQGYEAYPYGILPKIYEGNDVNYLAIAWKAGFERHREESLWAYGGY